VPWPAPDRSARRRAPRTRRTWLALVAGTALAVASVPLGNTTVAGIAVLFVIAWPLERIWRRHPVPVRRLALRTDLAYAVASPLVQGIGLAAAIVVGVLSFAWLPGLALRPLVSMLPAPVRTVVGLLLFDMLIYWTHRWSHTVPLFWRFHAVHHSTVHLDWVSGFRAHPLDGAFAAPAFAFVLAAGFDATATGALVVVQFVVGIWAHLNVRWRLRWLRHVVLTPDFHHWHHAADPAAHHSNYSTFLPVWDLLFGTFRVPETGPTRYGVDAPIPTTMGRQLLWPFRGARAEVARVGRSIRPRRRSAGAS
jgi:sterol desaturase/sphingolipid hydroxylase (fatty acid hydroxylase superfamily)